MLYNCSKLNHFRIPDSVESIGQGFCYGCNGLNTTYFGTIKVIPDYAYYAAALRKPVIPDTVEYIGDYAFRMRYGSMNTLTLGSKVKHIGNYAFDNNALSKVDIPDSVTEIGTFGFKSSNGNLKTLNIGSGITSIGVNAFNNTSEATITINKPENSVSGSPWGAANSTVIWNG